MELDPSLGGPSSSSAPTSRASDLARARLAKKRERERQRAEQEAQSQSLTSEEPPIITPSATESSFHSAYSSFDASMPGALALGLGLGGANSGHATGKPMVDADAAQHLAYIQEKDPFAAFTPPAAVAPPSLPSFSLSSHAGHGQSYGGGLGHSQRHPSESVSLASLSLSRNNSLRPSIDTAASMHRGVPAYKRREMLRPDHSVGIEEEQEWGEEEDTLDKVGEVELPPMPSYLSTSRLDLHPSESRNSRASMGSSLMLKSRRWDPHARREVEKAPDAPADFAVVKPDGWSAKGMGLDATFKREKRREDRRQLVGKVFGFGRKREKEEKRERWEEEIEGRSVSVGSGSNRDSGFIDLNPTSSKLSLTSSNASRPLPKSILKTRPPPLPLNPDGTSASASTEMLNTPTPRHAIVPPSASTITSQTSLRPTPKAYVHSPGMTETPATSLFPGSSASDDAHQGDIDRNGRKGDEEVHHGTGDTGQGGEKGYKAHLQSLPWGKANTSPPTTSPPPVSATLASPVSHPHPDPYPHPTPDFSRKATSTPDSYKYSPTAEAIARYALSDSDDTASLHRQFIAYGHVSGTPTTGANSVDSTPGTEMAPDRLFYKAPKASSTALGSVVGTPGLGVVDEYMVSSVPPVPSIPAEHATGQQGQQVMVGTAISADSAIAATAPGDRAATLGMSVQASASSSALPYLSPTLGTDSAHALTTSNTDYPTRPAPAAVVRSPDNKGRSLSPSKNQSPHPQARPLMRSSSSTSDRPGAIYDHSPSHSSATAEGLLTEALAAGESIWDSKIYMLVAAPVSSSLSYVDRKKRHWEAYDHPILRSRREKDKQATFDDLACGRVGWREWLWPVPPTKPDSEKAEWKRKDRRRTRRAARERRAERDRADGTVRPRPSRSDRVCERRDEEEEEEEEEVVISGRDWSKVKIDGYRPAPPPPSSAPAPKAGRTASFSSVDSPLTDLAHSASRLESSLNRSGSGTSQSRFPLATTSSPDSAIRRGSSHSRGSISSDVTDFTIRSAGSHGTSGTGGTARRVPPPTPPPAGPLPAAPPSAQSQRVLPQRAGSAMSHHAPVVIASPSKIGGRTRTGSFGAGTALRSGISEYRAEEDGYPASQRLPGAAGTNSGSGSMITSAVGSTSSLAGTSNVEGDGEAKLTPAERRRRMRGHAAAVDLAGEIKKIDQDREAELAAAEGPIDEDRPRVIRFAGVQVMGEP